MKKRLLSVFLALTMLAGLLPMTAFAADKGYGDAAISTGYTDVDWMADEILKEIDLAGKNDVERIRAVYDWIILNCERYGEPEKDWFPLEEVMSALDGGYRDLWEKAIMDGDMTFRLDLGAEFAGDDWFSTAMYDTNEYVTNCGYYMMVYRVGECHWFSGLLAVLLGRLGYDCRLIEGNFINNNGSKVMHKWNMVLLNGKYYWLDVRMDHANYERTGKLSYTYFMIDDQAQWEKKHEWDHSYSDALMAMAGEIEKTYTTVLGITGDIVGGLMPWSKCSDWAEDLMMEAVVAGLYPECLVDRDLTQPITRKEFAETAILFYEKLSGKAAPAVDPAKPLPFTDVTAADTYILQAYELGIVNGMGNGTYAPNETLTRAHAVTMLGRVCELVEVGNLEQKGAALQRGSTVIPAFTDGGAIADWAANYVSYFVSHGVINGVSTDPANPRFDPAGPMTCEAALKVAVCAMEQ